MRERFTLPRADAKQPASEGPGLRTAAAALALGGAVAFILGGCAATPATPPDSSATLAAIEAGKMTSDGLVMVNETPRSKLWVKPDHNLGRYDDVLVAGIAFAYAQGQERLNAGQEEQVGDMLVSAVNGITEGTPVGRANEPGECVVALELGLKDIRLHIGQAEGSAISYVSSFGEATMIVEFRDSLSEETLVRYAAHRGLGGGQGSGRMGANLGRLGRALSDMVTDMVTELQTIVPDTTERAETSCNDGIYKMTGRG